MFFSKRSAVTTAVRPPSFVQVFIEANQYIFNDFKRFFLALYPMLALLLVCTVGGEFSGRGFDAVWWMPLLWVAVYLYLNMLIVRDVIEGRQSGADFLNQRHSANKRCFFFLIGLMLFSALLAPLTMLIILPMAYYGPDSMRFEVLIFLSTSWIATMFALFLSVVASRWYLVVPALYDGVKLRLKDTKALSKSMQSHIFIWAVVVVLINIFFSFELFRDFSDMMSSMVMGADGEVLILAEPLRITLGIFMTGVIDFLCTLYFLIISSYAFCRIYQWCSQNAE